MCVPFTLQLLNTLAVVSGRWSELNLDSPLAEVTVLFNGLERSAPQGRHRLGGRVPGSWKRPETCLLVRLVPGIQGCGSTRLGKKGSLGEQGSSWGIGVPAGDFQAQAAELDNHLETLMGRTAGSMWEQSMEGFAIDDLSLTSYAVRVPARRTCWFE